MCFYNKGASIEGMMRVIINGNAKMFIVLSTLPPPCLVGGGSGIYSFCYNALGQHTGSWGGVMETFCISSQSQYIIYVSISLCTMRSVYKVSIISYNCTRIYNYLKIKHWIFLNAFWHFRARRVNLSPGKILAPSWNSQRESSCLRKDFLMSSFHLQGWGKGGLLCPPQGHFKVNEGSKVPH